MILRQINISLCDKFNFHYFYCLQLYISKFFLYLIFKYLPELRVVQDIVAHFAEESLHLLKKNKKG